jgi:precorrin-6B C5,15-methyltransferase / cobalt-precorrin-6B C5,C15-methyltransferase
VPGLVVLHAVAPDALANLPRPDAIFVGGGASVDGVIETCFSALGNGGRLVVHGVTLETEALLFAAMEKHGGELVRLSVEQAEPLGGFTGWTPARAITQWSVQR